MHDTPSTPEELRAEIRRLGPWHQDLEIAPGIRTSERAPGDDPDPLHIGNPGMLQPGYVLDILMRDVFPNGFEGRSLLDCGCNAGGYLFEAKRLGAGRCFGFDVREHWLNQARFVGRHRPGNDVEFAQLDLLALRERKLEPFDVTLFFGLFYHLPDPVAGLRIAADLTRELLVLNTAADPKLTGHALTLSVESDTALMSGVHRLAWLPTSARVLEEILRWCGFPHTRVHYVRSAPRFPRIQVLAARDARTFAHYDTIHPPQPPRRRPLWKRVARRLLRR
ncbi:MAG TPA: methyltransferase domain-containing protein [Thermoanaerobaculia bacterium]|nr:methyltransferase domain-containing protein [Thermoanaerobaculia bacterium]